MMKAKATSATKAGRPEEGLAVMPEKKTRGIACMRNAKQMSRNVVAGLKVLGSHRRTDRVLQFVQIETRVPSGCARRLVLDIQFMSYIEHYLVQFGGQHNRAPTIYMYSCSAFLRLAS